MIRRGLALALTSALLFGSLVALAQEAPPLPAEDSRSPEDRARRAQVVAHIGDVEITVGDVEDHVTQQSPFLRERYRDRSELEALVQNLVRFELLAREAAREGAGEDPVVRETTAQAAVQQMIRIRFDERITPQTIAATDVVAYYEAHPEEFTRPELRRASHILVATREEADALVAEARNADAAGFRTLAQDRSLDAETRIRGGDLRYFDSEGRSPASTEAEVAGPLVAAAYALTEVGSVSAPIEVEGQWSIVKLTGMRPAQHRDLLDASDSIRLRLWREQRQAAIEALVVRLHEQVGVEREDDLMRLIRLDEMDGAGEEEADEHGDEDESAAAPAAPSSEAEE